MTWTPHEPKHLSGSLAFGILIALGLAPCVWADLALRSEGQPRLTYLGLVFLAIGGVIAVRAFRAMRARALWTQLEVGGVDGGWSAGHAAAFGVRLRPRRPVQVTVDATLVCTFREVVRGTTTYHDGGVAHEARWRLAEGRPVGPGEAITLTQSAPIPADARVTSQRVHPDDADVRVDNQWRLEVRIRVVGLPALTVEHAVTVERPEGLDGSESREA